MKAWFTRYFNNALEVSTGKKILLIILGILLFVSLVLLGPIMALQQTVFNPDCVASYVNDIDVPSLAHNWLKENVAPKNPVLAKTAELVVINFEPQIKDQMRFFVRNMYAYVLDRLQKGKLLETVAAQKPMVDNLAAHVQAFMDLPVVSPVVQILGVNAESITKYVDLKQISGVLDLIGQLEGLKSLIAVLMVSFIPLLLLTVALVIAIVFIARKPGFISGELGLISAIGGVLQFIIILPAGSMGRSAISQFNLPPLIRDWLLRIVGDFNCIVMIYGGVLLLAGIVLIVVYYALKRVKQGKRL